VFSEGLAIDEPETVIGIDISPVQRIFTHRIRNSVLTALADESPSQERLNALHEAGLYFCEGLAVGEPETVRGIDISPVQRIFTHRIRNSVLTALADESPSQESLNALHEGRAVFCEGLAIGEFQTVRNGYVSSSKDNYVLELTAQADENLSPETLKAYYRQIVKNVLLVNRRAKM
ncbi:MAG: hypothetical protein IJS39_07415, partial [Synergistaceae bacterium]|nr:hypothetical protein [Synergistaceae bacterium]